MVNGVVVEKCEVLSDLNAEVAEKIHAEEPQRGKYFKIPT